jgi:hypothetical protein
MFSAGSPGDPRSPTPAPPRPSVCIIAAAPLEAWITDHDGMVRPNRRVLTKVI